MDLIDSFQKLSPKSVFLIDAIGAMITVFSLGFILPSIQHLVGLPVNVLNIITVIPIFFFLFSIASYFFLKDKWRPYMKVIALLNFLYCCLTFTLLVIHSDKIMILGYIYFIAEIIIVTSLAVMEYKKASA